MNRFAVALVTAAALAFAPALIPTVQAKPGQGASNVQIPITGLVRGTSGAPTTGPAGTFEGTFTLLKFVNNGGTLVAVGTIAGVAKDAAGTVLATGLQTVALPVSKGGTATAGVASAAAAAPVIAAASCPILNLVLGPLHLDLLGLVVDLNQVVLNITAVPGAGNLLGNLLCAVAGLLDPGPLANLLNQILDILNGIVGGL
jgi:hypothetical protein